MSAAEPQPPPKPAGDGSSSDSSSTASMWRQASRFSYVGIFFGVAILIGFGSGRWIERKWGGAPWVSLGGVLIGVIAGFRELYRVARPTSRVERMTIDPAQLERTGRLVSVERWALGLGSAASLLAFLFLGRGLALGVSIGAALMALNAIAMRRLGEKVWAMLRSDTAQGKARPARTIILFNLKMVALIAAIYLVVRELHVDPVGLLIGLSIYPVATVAVALTYVPPADAVVSQVPVEDSHG